MPTRTLLLTVAGAALLSTTALADDSGRALTIYNENFAVVRETVPMSLDKGVNHVTFNDITYHVEPDSVILRDPTGKHSLQILEQNYRADPVTQDLLLSVFEGQTIDFEVQHGDQTQIIQGKIVRSGYVPHTQTIINYGYPYYQQQQTEASDSQPIIEVDGKLRFSLPGTPLFPDLPNDSILKPTLDWTLQSDEAGPVNAELAYITTGLSWKADYNVVAPEDGDDVDIVGWVTLDNQSGHTFDNAKIKLMAGDVNKVVNQSSMMMEDALSVGGTGGYAPPVSEKTFDDYHLYTLDRATTLRDRETKQVQFLTASHVHSKVIYVYDGADIDSQYSNWGYVNIRTQGDYGAKSNPKVWTMREIVNSEANHLGMPLPKGRMRFYRKDSDGQLEFIGENDIDHTPKDETLRVYTGNAFDLTGERRQVSFNCDYNKQMVDESFDITLHNHKKTPVEIRVVEHLYREANWTISKNTAPFVKTDAHTIEFDVKVDPDQDKKVDYSAHYWW